MDEDAYVLTEQQKTDARRMMGYSARGAGNYGFESYRYFTYYGDMEFRLANMSQSDGDTFVGIYLTQCLAAEQQIFAARSNLQVDEASIYKHNKAEIAQLRKEFTKLRMAMCDFIEVPAGPNLDKGSFSITYFKV